MNKKKVVVIGAGVAGLATAARLASIGFEVVVFEKNSEPGGKLTAFEKVDSILMLVQVCLQPQIF